MPSKTLSQPRYRRNELAKPLATSLVELVRGIVQAELAAMTKAPTILRAGELGLGSRRHEAELCRTGRLHGARKVGKSWYVPAASVAAFLEAEGKPAVPPANDVADDEVAQLVARRAARGRR